MEKEVEPGIVKIKVLSPSIELTVSEFRVELSSTVSMLKERIISTHCAPDDLKVIFKSLFNLNVKHFQNSKLFLWVSQTNLFRWVRKIKIKKQKIFISLLLFRMLDFYTEGKFWRRVNVCLIFWKLLTVILTQFIFVVQMPTSIQTRQRLR